MIMHEVRVKMVVHIRMVPPNTVPMGSPLSIDESDPRNLVLIIVVLVLVAPLNQFLLGFLQTERAYKALPFT